MSANPFANYTVAKVGNISPAKLERALKGLDVRLTNADLSGDRVIIVHPLNARAIKKAQMANKGLTTTFTPFEALADLDYHEHAGEGMHGGSLWSWLKEKAYPWLKKNWNVIKPVVSAVADVAAPALSTALTGSPQAGVAGRQALKALTGVGVKGSKLVKGSQEARDHMKQLRERRRGGSFRMP